MTETITITCPECHAPHALFWLVDKGNKKAVYYRCNKATHFVESPVSGRKEEKTYTVNRVCPKELEPDNLAARNIPEEWTAAYRKEVQGQQQNQFILMNK